MDLRRGVAVLSGALLLTPAGLAGAAKQCTVGPPTVRSYTWDFVSEADNIFNRMQREAVAVHDAAEGLKQDARYDGKISWQLHAKRLSTAKENVNSMGEDLCRLHSIRRELSPLQKRMLDRITPQVRSLAANTEVAIETLNKNRGTLYATNYPERVGRIFEESGSVSKSVNNFLELARLRHEEQELRQPGETAS